MGLEIVAIEDLQEFMIQLPINLKELLQGSTLLEPKNWLKSYQVHSLPKISAGTLQNLRKNGTLQYSVIGGLL